MPEHARSAHQTEADEEEGVEEILREELRVVSNLASPNYLREILLEAACELRKRPVASLDCALRYPLPITAKDGNTATVYLRVFTHRPHALSTYQVHLCTDVGSTVLVQMDNGDHALITEDGIGPLPMDAFLKDTSLVWLEAQVQESPTDWKFLGLGLGILLVNLLIAIAIVLAES